MKKLTVWLTLGCALACGAAYAEEKKELTPQQTRMAQCNKEAGDRKGEERKKFMSECLSHKPAQTAQQNRMTQCNREAGERKGEERKQFMSECLRNK